MVGVRRAAARAVELSPAVRAVGTGVDVGGGEGVPQRGVGHALADAAEPEARVADELVAGIEIPPRRDGHIFRARPAARDALIDAGAALKIEHVVVKGERPSLTAAGQHQLGQLFVLLEHDGKVGLGQRGRVVRRADDRLHAQLGEAEVEHRLDVLQKIGIGVREGAAHIVISAAARFDQPLELGDDPLPASVARVVDAVAVVNLPTAVQTQHHVAALAVGEIDDVVVDEQAVGREREAEVFARLLFDAARVGDEVLDDLKIHQRLAAEEIHLQIAPSAGMGDEVIQREAADLEGHQRALALILPLTGEAIGAVEIAGVRNVQAERLDHARAAVLQLAGHVRKRVGREQPARRLERFDLREAVLKLAGGDAVGGVCMQDVVCDFPAGMGLIHADDVERRLVHHMDRAGADVQHDVQPAELIAVYHNEIPRNLEIWTM